MDQSFSRRQMAMIDRSRCSHCGQESCQIDFIFSWIARDDHQQQAGLDQRVEEMISKRLPSSDPQNACEQRLLHWYHSMRRRRASAERTTDYQEYFLSQSNAFPPDDPLFSPLVYDRLSSSSPSQTFTTQNRAGLYQLSSNGRYILADDWCPTYKGHRLSQSMRCLTIYNQYEEQCVLMLPEFNTMTQMDAVQSLTWHEHFQIFLFITYHRVYQCEPESGTINQISEYEIPSSRHSLAHLACDQQSSVFLAYQYPAVSLDLWHISPMATWSLIKRWTPRELFPPPSLSYEDDDDDDEQESGVCGIASMRYANDRLHILARHERHWCLHLFRVVTNDKHQPRLVAQRRIDLDLVHLRLSGENFQMEVLPGEQGWLFAIRRPYLIHLDANGKDARKVILASSKPGTDSIANVCIMDERGKRRENSKHLVVRDSNSIRFYKL